MEVSVVITRGDIKTTTPLVEVGDSRKGTFKLFTPKAETADLPSFAKLYVKVGKASAKANGKKVVKQTS